MCQHSEDAGEVHRLLNFVTFTPLSEKRLSNGTWVANPERYNVKLDGSEVNMWPWANGSVPKTSLPPWIRQ